MREPIFNEYYVRSMQVKTKGSTVLLDCVLSLGFGLTIEEEIPLFGVDVCPIEYYKEPNSKMYQACTSYIVCQSLDVLAAGGGVYVKVLFDEKTNKPEGCFLYYRLCPDDIWICYNDVLAAGLQQVRLANTPALQD